MLKIQKYSQTTFFLFFFWFSSQIMGEYHLKFERQQNFNWKVYRSSIKYFTWYSLLHSLRKANDHSYDFYNCGEYKVTSKRFLINIKTIQDNRHKSLGKIVIGHLNINSIRQKIDSLIEITATIIDILIISETKLELEFSKRWVSNKRV